MAKPWKSKTESSFKREWKRSDLTVFGLIEKQARSRCWKLRKKTQNHTMSRPTIGKPDRQRRKFGEHYFSLYTKSASWIWAYCWTLSTAMGTSAVGNTFQVHATSSFTITIVFPLTFWTWNRDLPLENQSFIPASLRLAWMACLRAKTTEAVAHNGGSCITAKKR